eukprot:g37187.t1
MTLRSRCSSRRQRVTVFGLFRSEAGSDERVTILAVWTRHLHPLVAEFLLSGEFIRAHFFCCSYAEIFDVLVLGCVFCERRRQVVSIYLSCLDAMSLPPPLSGADFVPSLCGEFI